MKIGRLIALSNAMVVPGGLIYERALLSPATQETMDLFQVIRLMQNGTRRRQFRPLCDFHDSCRQPYPGSHVLWPRSAGWPEK